MYDFLYGRNSSLNAPVKHNPADYSNPFTNNITRRNSFLTQRFDARSISTCMASANIKALRLFRHICRLLPFVIKVHEIPHRITPIQAKRYVANHFRKNSTITNPLQVDRLVQRGYEHIYQAQMHYSNTGNLFRFIFSQNHNWRDQAINHINDPKTTKNRKAESSKFLQSFYTGNKSHSI